MAKAKSGIVGWGTYIPQHRIKAEEIAFLWGFDREYLKGIWIEEKAVGSIDEDSVTIGYRAAVYAIKRAGVDPKQIDAVYLGTESKPYAVKPGATVIAEALGVKPERLSLDLEFACRAASEAIRIGASLVESGYAKYVLAVGADTAQASPGDVLEFTVSCGGAAYVIGSAEESAAVFEGMATYSTDTPDFWRRDGTLYPRHGEGFTGEPAYFDHVVSAAKLLMDRLGLRPSDFDYAVFHQPNGKFPLRVASMLGIPKEKVMPGVVTPWIGNTYNASMLIGLAKVLEQAKPGQRILAVSFGSGAGSDAFSIVVTDRVLEVADRAPKVEQLLRSRRYVGYNEYAKMRGLLKMYKL